MEGARLDEHSNVEMEEASYCFVYSMCFVM